MLPSQFHSPRFFHHWQVEIVAQNSSILTAQTLSRRPKKVVLETGPKRRLAWFFTIDQTSMSGIPVSLGFIILTLDMETRSNQISRSVLPPKPQDRLVGLALGSLVFTKGFLHHRWWKLGFLPSTVSMSRWSPRLLMFFICSRGAQQVGQFRHQRNLGQLWVVFACAASIVREDQRGARCLDLAESGKVGVVAAQRLMLLMFIFCVCPGKRWVFWIQTLLVFPEFIGVSGQLLKIFPNMGRVFVSRQEDMFWHGLVAPWWMRRTISRCSISRQFSISCWISLYVMVRLQKLAWTLSRTAFPVPNPCWITRFFPAFDTSLTQEPGRKKPKVAFKVTVVHDIFFKHLQVSQSEPLPKKGVNQIFGFALAEPTFRPMWGRWPDETGDLRCGCFYGDSTPETACKEHSLEQRCTELGPMERCKFRGQRLGFEWAGHHHWRGWSGLLFSELREVWPLWEIFNGTNGVSKHQLPPKLAEWQGGLLRCILCQCESPPVHLWLWSICHLWIRGPLQKSRDMDSIYCIFVLLFFLGDFCEWVLVPDTFFF